MNELWFKFQALEVTRSTEPQVKIKNKPIKNDDMSLPHS